MIDIFISLIFKVEFVKNVIQKGLGCLAWTNLNLEKDIKRVVDIAGAAVNNHSSN